MSPANDILQIFKSSDFNSWTSLGFLTNTTGSNLFTDTNATGPKRFYRAQK
jgi:hypothetical protein